MWCRGKFRSKSWQGVLEEAKELVASGVKELNLIAEDTNQYGKQLSLNLPFTAFHALWVCAVSVHVVS